jgi:hypothetical protein
MSIQKAAFVDEGQRANRRSRRRARRAVVAGATMLLGIGGLAGCGDDDDASESVPAQTDEAVESSAPAGDVTTTTTASTTTARPTTTVAEAPATTEAAVETTDVATTAGAETTAVPDAAAESTAPAAETADATTPAGVDSSVPTGSEPPGTATGSSGPTTSAGPTTTGPECEYTENDEFPLERCDAGPAIAAVQSVLQAREYEIGTVDCLFGDQTHYAVKAFQTDEELTVSGNVDEETWTALDILDDWGTDTNGSGSIEPNEITLTCA